MRPPQLALLLLLPVLLLAPARADEPAIGDERVLPRHLDFAEAVAGRIPLDQVIALGRTLFEARFTVEDGAGRPGATQAIVPTRRVPGNRPAFFRTAGPDASACVGCHNQPGTGGAGDFVANVFVSEGFADAEFDSLDPQFSNERGSPAMNGDGLVELLAR